VARTTAVPETGISLCVEEIFHGETELVDRLFVLFLQPQVEHGIVERSSKEELER
jgi:hypothetical protein